MKDLSRKHTKRARRVSIVWGVILVVLLLLFQLSRSSRFFASDDAIVDEYALRGKVPVAAEHDEGLRSRESEHARRRKNSRTAIGRVAEDGINSDWSFVVVNNLEGNAERGDEAYIARLGPHAGVMTVESVDGNVAILNLSSELASEIRQGDRIETVPPAISE